MEFIDPNYIANLKPFNILNNHVWHFSDNTLYTLNNQVYNLIYNVTNTGIELILTADLEQELKKAGVTDYLKKLRYILSRLYQFLIHKVVAIKGVDLASIGTDADKLFRYRRSSYIVGKEHAQLNTLAHVTENCDCINCNYRSLDFKRMIRKTKTAKRKENLTAKELAYAHYELATDNYKECYDIYKQAERDSKGVENKNIEYFLTKINLSYLHNLVSGHDDDNNEILQYIKQIDLDRSLHHELDVYVDEDVRRYLIKVKEFQLFNDIEKKITELLDEIRDKQSLFENNGHYSGPNHLVLLNHQYHLLYSHFHKNYLIYDAFSDFKKAVTNVFEALLVSYKTKDYGLTSFTEFYLTEAVLYIHPKDLINLFENTGDLKIESDQLEQFLVKVEAFLCSQFDRHQFGAVPNPEIRAQLTNYNFKYKFENIFSNVFTMLSHLSIREEHANRLVQPIIDFVETEDYLAHYDLRQLGLYLERHGKSFKRHQVVDLLKFTIGHIRRGFIKYDSLIASLCKQYTLVSPSQPLNERSLIKRAIANQSDDHGHFDFRDLLEMYPILDEAGQSYFKEEILNELYRNFDAYYYIELLERNILTWDEGDLFTKFIQRMARANYETTPVFDGETYDLRNTNMANFLAHYHICGVPSDYPALTEFDNLSEFGIWGLNPEMFDYEKFDPRWLLVIYPTELMKRIAEISPAKEMVSAYLKEKPDSKLAPLYIKYFI